MSTFDILGAAVSGMEAQRAAMDVDARNVALSQTGDIHHPARGLVPQFANVLAAQDDTEPGFAAIEARMNEAPDDGPASGTNESGAVVAFTGVRSGTQPVDSVSEMVNVLDAQRAYEADASVFDIGKRLLERTIEMGKL
jgi:flagellar basal-body rod protein FlgC